MTLKSIWEWYTRASLTFLKFILLVTLIVALALITDVPDSLSAWQGIGLILACLVYMPAVLYVLFSLPSRAVQPKENLS